MGRSRSRSRSRSRDRRRQRSSSGSSSPDYRYNEGYRIHIGDLGIDVSKNEIEHYFKKFGPMCDVWVARSPPCFAFVAYRHREDAEDAIREMNGKTLMGCRVRVSYARPRNQNARRRKTFDPNLRCYQCGERGHFSRDCQDVQRNRRDNKYSYGGGGGGGGSRSHSRSRSRSPRRKPNNASRPPRRERQDSERSTGSGRRKSRGGEKVIITSASASHGVYDGRSRSRSSSSSS